MSPSTDDDRDVFRRLLLYVVILLIGTGLVVFGLFLGGGYLRGRVTAAGLDQGTFPLHPQDMDPTQPIPWAVEDLDAYFVRHPSSDHPLDTKADRQARMARRQAEWAAHFQSRLVEWEGELRRVDPDRRIAVRCGPRTHTTDVHVRVKENLSGAELRKGDSVKFRAHLDHHGLDGWHLTDGVILSVTPPQPSAGRP
jgi:hypothetical protein